MLLAEVVGRHVAAVHRPSRTASRSSSASASRSSSRALRERYALEVSSPGTDRPLTKPAHFHRFLGRRARVRTREARDGHTSFTGELVGATDEEVTIAVDDGVVAIPYSAIARSNLVPGE